MTPSALNPSSKTITWPFLSQFLLSYVISVPSPPPTHGRITHSHATALPRFIRWTPSVNLLAFFHQPGDTVQAAFRPTSPRATTHLHRRQGKSPCQLDMTHAMPHTHHCDNPVIINTNLSASARAAKVLWSRREGGKGKGKADTLSTGRGTVISGSEIRHQVWMWLCTHRTVRQEEG